MSHAIVHAIEAETELVASFRPRHIRAHRIVLFDARQRHPTGDAKTVIAVDADVRETLLPRIYAADSGDVERRRKVLAEIDATYRLVLPLIANHTVKKKRRRDHPVGTKRHVLYPRVASARVGTRRRANTIAKQVLTDNQGLHDAVVAEHLLLIAEVVVDLDVVVVAIERRHGRGEVVGLAATEVLRRIVALNLQRLRAQPVRRDDVSYKPRAAGAIRIAR